MFILTRTFAISALFVGAAQLASAAPSGSRLCGGGGYSCMDAVDPVPDTSSTTPSTSDVTTPTVVEIIELTSSEITDPGTSVDLEDSDPTPEVIELLSSPPPEDTPTVVDPLSVALSESLSNLD